MELPVPLALHTTQASYYSYCIYIYYYSHCIVFTFCLLSNLPILCILIEIYRSKILGYRVSEETLTCPNMVLAFVSPSGWYYIGYNLQFYEICSLLKSEESKV